MDDRFDPEATSDAPAGAVLVDARRVVRSRTGLGASWGMGRPRIRIPVVRIAIVVLGIAAVALALARPTPPPARSTADPFANVLSVRWSPDGSRLAYVVQTRAPLGPHPSASAAAATSDPSGAPAYHLETWVVDADGANNRLIDRRNPAVDGEFEALAWSPDGTRLLASVDTELELLTLDGAPPVVVRDTASGYLSGPAWSPDGSSFVFARGSETGPAQAYRGRLDGTVSAMPLSGGYLGELQWSPGGLLVYSTYDEPTNANELWVAQPDGSSSRFLGPCCIVGWATNGDPLIDSDGVIRDYPLRGDGEPGPIIELSGWQQTPAGWVTALGGSIEMDAPTGRRVLTTPTDVVIGEQLNPSPSGDYVAFLGHQGSRAGLFSVSTDGGEAATYLLPNVGDPGAWSPNAAVAHLAIIQRRAILVVDVTTGTVRTLVPRDSIAGPALGAGTPPTDRLVIGPDGPTSDTLVVSREGQHQLIVENDSDVTWESETSFDRFGTICRLLAPDGSLGAFLQPSPCVVVPHRSVAILPGPAPGAAELWLNRTGLGYGQGLRVFIDFAP